MLTYTHSYPPACTLGLVPDAYVAGCADRVVGPLPGRQVGLLCCACEAVEVREAAPVLHDGRPIDPGVVPLQQAGIWVLI